MADVRRAKTDRIDGGLVALCSPVSAGEPRGVRWSSAGPRGRKTAAVFASERKEVLNAERFFTVNDQGLLFSQGITGTSRRRDRRERLEQLQTGEGHTLPDHLKGQCDVEPLDLNCC